MLATLPQQNITYVQPAVNDDHLRWLDYFDPAAALESTINHVEALPGSRHERHTMRAYLSSLADFAQYLGAGVRRYGDEDYDINWDTCMMPTRAAVGDYIAYCARRGLTASTITRYMAAVRHWLRALEEQSVFPQNGGDFVFIIEAQRQFKLAGTVKNPAPDRTSNRPALEQHGTRLSLQQVNALFDSFAGEMQTLTGKRDLALLYLGITSGLRAAEIARITLNSITQGRDCYEVKVRGKRSNYDPVGIDATAYELIVNFVDSWNARAGMLEGVQIGPGDPVFQPLLKGDHLPAQGLRGFDVRKGMTSRAILKIVERRTHDALGKAITAHDMRRTCAYLMRSHGYEWDQIRGQLRHRSIGTTEKYVGREQDLSKGLLSKRVTFQVPR